MIFKKKYNYEVPISNLSHYDITIDTTTDLKSVVDLYFPLNHLLSNGDLSEYKGTSVNKITELTELEEIFYKIHFDYHNNSSTGFIKNNIRIISTKDKINTQWQDNKYFIFNYSIKSEIDINRTNNVIAVFIPFKEGNNNIIFDKTEYTRLLIDIIDQILMNYIKNNYQQIQYNNSLKNGDYYVIDTNQHRLSLLEYKFIIDYYIELFTLLDSILDLKYGDYEFIYSLLTSNDRYIIEYDIMHLIYDYTIEGKSDNDKYYSIIDKLYNAK